MVFTIHSDVLLSFIEQTDDLDVHIGLASGYPEYPLFSQSVLLKIIHICPVYHRYVPGFHVSTQLTHVAATMMIGRILDHAYGYERDQVKANMYFYSGFVFPVFSPVHVFGYQINSRGLNSPDGPLEAPRQPEITSPSLSKKLRMCLLVMLDSFPEKLLYQRDIPCAIGM